MPDPGSAAAVYVQLVNEQLAQADRLKDSFETRAVSLASLTGALVAALFAVVANFDGDGRHGLPMVTKIFVVATVIAFANAVRLALGVLKPSEHPLIAPDELKSAVRKNWSQSADQADWLIVHFSIDALRMYRDRNAEKAARIRRMVEWQLGAVASLTIAIVAVVWP